MRTFRMPSTCIVCRKVGGNGVSMFRIPPKSNQFKRDEWVKSLQLNEADLRDHHRVCSRHFPNGDSSQVPHLYLESLVHVQTPRRLRKTKRKSLSFIGAPRRRLFPAIQQASGISTSSPPGTESDRVLHTDEWDGDKSDHEALRAVDHSNRDSSSPITGKKLITPIGEVYFTDYSVIELPSEESSNDASSNSYLDKGVEQTETNEVVDIALLARIEALEMEVHTLENKLSQKKPSHFRLENISCNNSLVSFYTGFQTYDLLLAFYEFLGPSVNKLTYWGSDSNKSDKRRKMKLDPINQLFLALIKQKLNLPHRDLAHRFGISVSVVSKYFITWICFLYCHLHEIDWMPTVEQVKGTLPYAFKENTQKHI